MQLTLYTDYSLRVLVYLSLHQNRPTTVAEIADFYQISRNHLVKVVHNLSSKKYITSTRGKGGGVRLSRSPELIRIGDVILDTEPNFNIVECFNTARPNTCSVEPICQLKNIFGSATQDFINTLNEYSISDVLVNRKTDSKNPEELSIPIQEILTQLKNIPA